MPLLLSRLLASPPPRRLQQDSVAFFLADGRRVDVLRVRDPRARSIKLSVGERGARLTLPMRVSLVAGERFLHEHRGWLTMQMQALDIDIRPLQRGVCENLWLRDATVPLRWAEGRFASLQLDQDGAVFQLPATARDAAISRALRDFYEAQARADVARWMPKYIDELPRPPARIRFRVLSSQWGSLAPDGTLTLDLALVLGRPSAFEYVLVHELCHLIHADHSRRFWREVEARFPAWRDERDYFKTEGRRLKSALHTLLG